MVVIAVSLFITSLGTPKFAERIEQPAEEKRRLGDVVLVPTHGQSGHLSGRLLLAGQIAEANGGLVLPVVVTIPHQDQNLSEARTRKEEIDDVLHSLGLASDSRIRVDRTLSEGIKQAALENDASLILLGWERLHPVTSFFTKSVANEVSRLVECPVAVAVVSESPIEQVILAISEADLAASRLNNLQSAVSIAISAAARKPLIVGPVTPAQLEEAGIFLPEKTEYKPSDMDMLPWVEQISNGNSLVVSLSRTWAIDRIAAEMIRSGCSLVAVITR